MKKLALFVTCILIVGMQVVNAQVKSISGTVTSADDGSFIPGVSVILKGTTLGTVTNIDGYYHLDVPEDAQTLIFSFVGMKTSEMPITGSVINVALQADILGLDEVMVVAYGTAKREAVTGSIESIDAGSIETRNLSSATAIIEGASPGVQVNNTYGEPGEDPKIRIRGFTSVNGENDPLVVVDGVAYTGRISDINPKDIESMTVLKDAASAALYGNRASNGVIMITTKMGSSEKLEITASMNFGTFSRGISEFERMAPDQWMETMWTGYKNFAVSSLDYSEADAATFSTENVVGDVIRRNIYNKGDTELFDGNGKLVSGAKVLAGYDDLDWSKYIERSGMRQDYNISANVATDKYKFFSSLSYLNEEGYVITSDLERYTARINTNFTPNKWLSTGMNLFASNSIGNYASSAEGTLYINPFNASRHMAPVYPVFLHDSDGGYTLDENGSRQYDLSSSYLSNRHIVYELENNQDKRYRTNVKAQAYATISFLNDFKFTVRGDKTILKNKLKNYDNPEVGDGAGSNGRLYYSMYDYDIYTLQEQLFWSKQLNLNFVDVLIGHENYSYNRAYNRTAITGIKVAGIIENSNFSNMTTMDGYTRTYRTESFLARMRYNYDGKYYLDASFRRDGSSRFYSSSRWGNFYSLGASWTVSKEDFMRSVSMVNYLKIRASYGEVGNDAGGGNYGYMALYYIDQNGGEGAYFRNNLENNDLKWEATAAFDVAVEGRLFNRMNFDIDYFDKRSRDLLFDVILPLSNGATEDLQNGATITRNIGTLSNHGLEVSFDVDILNRGELRWNFGMDGTFLKNKLIKLPDGEDIISGNYKYSEGHSIYEFWTYKYAGVDQMNGDALYNIDDEEFYAFSDNEDESRTQISEEFVREVNGEYYTINTTYAKRDWSGSAIPKVYGSVSNNLSYGDFDLNVLLTYSLGGKMYDGSYRSLMSASTSSADAIHTDLAEAWSGVPNGMTETAEGRIDPNGIPRVDMYNNTYFNSMSDRWLLDASYLVIKNISLGYTLPKKYTNRMSLSALSLRVGVENLATFTAIKGLNPQYNFKGGSDRTFVTARVFSLGVDIKL